MSLWLMSCSGSVLILVIALIRRITINILPKKTFLVLWGVVFFRLMVPYAIPSVISVYSFAEQNRVVSKLSEWQTKEGNPTESQAKMKMMKNQPQMPVYGRTFLSVWLMIWFTEMLLCAAFFVISYLRCYFQFQTSLPAQNDFTVQWLKTHRLRRSITIRQSDTISAPLTYRILHPVILMPKETDWDNTKQLEYILQHEYVHICRFDTASKLVSALVLCVHWFNPFVWVMYILFNRDIELACDESVVHWFGTSSKSNYAHTLISLEAKKSGLMPFCNSFSKNAIEERITAIMKTRQTTIISHVFSGLIIFAVIIMFATSATTAKELDHNALSVISDTQTGQKDITVNAEKTKSIIHERADILYYENGAPYIHDILANNTDKTIVETEYCMLAYDENGSPLKLYWNFLDSSAISSYENLVRSKEKILPNQTEDYRGGWSLLDSQATYALVCLKQVVFEDGTDWINPNYENWFASYAGNVISVEDLQNYYPYKYEME